MISTVLSVLHILSHLILPTVPFYSTSATIKYLAQGHTAQIWCWRPNSNLEESTFLPVPSRQAAVWITVESREELAALDIHIWKNDFGLLKLYKQKIKHMVVIANLDPPLSNSAGTSIKMAIWGTSLVAQWLSIHLPMQGTRVRSLVREDPTCCRATKPVCHNHWACTLEPVCHNYWSLWA